MRDFRVSTCCGRYNLRTGSKIIAVAGLISQSILLILGCVQRGPKDGGGSAIIVSSLLGIVAAGLLLYGTL